MPNPAVGQPEKQDRPSLATEAIQSISTAAIKIDPHLTGFHAETALRCAWLRVHANLLFDVDPSGQLSANLRDFADLLEVAEAHRWFR